MHLAAYGHEQHVACRPGDPTQRPRIRNPRWVTCRNCLRTLEHRIDVGAAEQVAMEGVA